MSCTYQGFLQLNLGPSFQVNPEMSTYVVSKLKDTDMTVGNLSVIRIYPTH